MDAASRERASRPARRTFAIVRAASHPAAPADAVAPTARTTRRRRTTTGGGARRHRDGGGILAYLLARRLDVVLGLAALAVALWLRADDAFHDDAKDKSASPPWRAAFAACVLLGRLVPAP